MTPTAPPPGDGPTTLDLIRPLYTDDRLGFSAVGVMSYILERRGDAAPVTVAEVLEAGPRNEGIDAIGQLISAGYLIDDGSGTLHVVDAMLPGVQA